MRRGFSLVELSIVLVILGLLVGGILAGQSLIRASELRSVSADFAKYKTAIHAFQDKYLGWPGDITNATAFWGKSSSLCATHSGSAATPGTCNGDGDGRILYTGEATFSWQQLGLAGVIEGSYATTGAPALGVTVPASRLSGGGYALLDRDQQLYQSKGPVGNFIRFASIYIPGNSISGSIISAPEAWNIDTKLDDGRADRGRLMTIRGSGNFACVTNSVTSSSSDYLLDDPAINCALVYWLN